MQVIKENFVFSEKAERFALQLDWERLCGEWKRVLWPSQKLAKYGQLESSDKADSLKKCLLETAKFHSEVFIMFSECFENPQQIAWDTDSPEKQLWFPSIVSPQILLGWHKLLDPLIEENLVFSEMHVSLVALAAISVMDALNGQFSFVHQCSKLYEFFRPDHVSKWHYLSDKIAMMQIWLLRGYELELKGENSDALTFYSYIEQIQVEKPPKSAFVDDNRKTFYTKDQWTIWSEMGMHKLFFLLLKTGQIEAALAIGRKYLDFFDYTSRDIPSNPYPSTVTNPFIVSTANGSSSGSLEAETHPLTYFHLRKIAVLKYYLSHSLQAFPVVFSGIYILDRLGKPLSARSQILKTKRQNATAQAIRASLLSPRNKSNALGLFSSDSVNASPTTAVSAVMLTKPTVYKEHKDAIRFLPLYTTLITTVYPFTSGSDLSPVNVQRYKTTEECSDWWIKALFVQLEADAPLSYWQHPQRIAALYNLIHVLYKLSLHSFQQMRLLRYLSHSFCLLITAYGSFQHSCEKVEGLLAVEAYIAAYKTRLEREISREAKRRQDIQERRNSSDTTGTSPAKGKISSLPATNNIDFSAVEIPIVEGETVLDCVGVCIAGMILCHLTHDGKHTMLTKGIKFGQFALNMLERHGSLLTESEKTVAVVQANHQLAILYLDFANEVPSLEKRGQSLSLSIKHANTSVEFMQNYSDNRGILFTLALGHSLSGHRDTALSLTIKHLEHLPHDLEAVHLLVLLESARGNCDGALRALDAGLDAFEKDSMRYARLAESPPLLEQVADVSPEMLLFPKSFYNIDFSLVQNGQCHSLYNLILTEAFMLNQQLGSKEALDRCVSLLALWRLIFTTSEEKRATSTEIFVLADNPLLSSAGDPKNPKWTEPHVPPVGSFPNINIPTAESRALLVSSWLLISSFLRAQGAYEDAKECIEEALSVLDKLGQAEETRQKILFNSEAVYQSYSGDFTSMRPRISKQSQSSKFWKRFLPFMSDASSDLKRSDYGSSGSKNMPGPMQRRCIADVGLEALLIQYEENSRIWRMYSSQKTKYAVSWQPGVKYQTPTAAARLGLSQKYSLLETSPMAAHPKDAGLNGGVHGSGMWASVGNARASPLQASPPIAAAEGAANISPKSNFLGNNRFESMSSLSSIPSGGSLKLKSKFADQLKDSIIHLAHGVIGDGPAREQFKFSKLRRRRQKLKESAVKQQHANQDVYSLSTSVSPPYVGTPPLNTSNPAPATSLYSKAVSEVPFNQPSDNFNQAFANDILDDGDIQKVRIENLETLLDVAHFLLTIDASHLATFVFLAAIYTELGEPSVATSVLERVLNHNKARGGVGGGGAASLWLGGLTGRWGALGLSIWSEAFSKVDMLLPSLDGLHVDGTSNRCRTASASQGAASDDEVESEIYSPIKVHNNGEQAVNDDLLFTFPSPLDLHKLNSDFEMPTCRDSKESTSLETSVQYSLVRQIKLQYLLENAVRWQLCCPVRGYEVLSTSTRF